MVRARLLVHVPKREAFVEVLGTVVLDASVSGTLRRTHPGASSSRVWVSAKRSPAFASDHTDTKGVDVADRTAGGRTGGIGLGGILVIVGIVLAIILGHWWIGLIIALIGLVFFGGFAKGKWY